MTSFSFVRDKSFMRSMLSLAVPVAFQQFITAGLNMASADAGRHEKAKRQLIGIALGAVVIFGAKAIVQALIAFVPGGGSF